MSSVTNKQNNEIQNVVMRLIVSAGKVIHKLHIKSDAHHNAVLTGH